MQLLIEPNGGVRCLYSEAIALGELGRLQIERGSHAVSYTHLTLPTN